MLLVLTLLLVAIYIVARNVSNAYMKEDYLTEINDSFEPRKHWDPSFNYSDSLEFIYGRNKIIPELYKDQILLALAHYPELKETRIEFIVEPAVIPIASRPKPSTVFYSKPNRWYCIVISDDGMDGMEPALLENLSFNSQVGVIGHELGHTAYYKDRSPMGLVGLALAYPFNKFRVKFERETDLRTVDHGLGWQLLEWALELRKGESNDFLDKYYLTPGEIEEAMSKSGLY